LFFEHYWKMYENIRYPFEDFIFSFRVSGNPDIDIKIFLDFYSRGLGLIVCITKIQFLYTIFLRLNVFLNYLIHLMTFLKSEILILWHIQLRHLTNWQIERIYYCYKIRRTNWHILSKTLWDTWTSISWAK